MAKYQDARPFEGKNADVCFSVAEAALSSLGFEAWIKRPMAWLLLARRTDREGAIEANIACRPAAGALVSIILSSGTASEEALKAICEQIFAAMAVELG